MIVLWLGFTFLGGLQAQTSTNTINLGLGLGHIEISNAVPASAATNAVPVMSLSAETTNPPPANPIAPPAPVSVASAVTPPLTVTSGSEASPSTLPGSLILAALMIFGALGGFLLYQGGLTRAKNCGQSSTLLLVGVVFGLVGYWMGGFAVQTGGVGDAHAALNGPLPAMERSALDHELGLMVAGHHWGLMGSSGFFLTTDPGSTNGIAALFLGQAAMLTIAVAAALGAALERARITAMAIASLLIGALIYPLLANWVWGGGWLAEMGHEFGLGHGFVDLAGAGVVHETAGTLALVIAVVLGPRYGRFGRNKTAPDRAIPGHHMPFVILGAVTLLISWMAANVSAGGDASGAGLAAVNTLLAAVGGLVVSFLLAGWQKRRPEPALLCRGLLGGAIAISACSAWVDPWAAFVIGGVAGLLVQGAMTFLERRRIDDPVGVAATHGAGGAWGVLATGLFANGTAGQRLNGIDDPVRGLLFGGAWQQLAAQAIGCVTGFVIVFILGYACLILIQKIVGVRVDLADEAEGLDWPQTGALGYQGDAEAEDVKRSG